MKGKIYAVPIGVINGQFVTTIELFVKDLLLVVNPANSLILNSEEEAEEKYSEFKEIKEIEIDKDSEDVLKKLSDIIKTKEEFETTIFLNLENTIKEAIEEMKASPKIHIPTMGEINQLKQEGFENSGSSIIIDDF